MIDRVEQTLNGGYAGLYGEVVEYDWYRLKELRFTPDVIFDLGANVGVFTRYARRLFPEALIVAVEPDEENYANLVKFTLVDHKMVLIKSAIGNFGMYRVRGAINGAHEVYVNEPNENSDAVTTSSVMIDELVNRYLSPGMKSLMKMDIEGNELVVWDHAPSMSVLRRIDYFTGEIHWSMLTGEKARLAQEKSLSALYSLGDTHNVTMDASSFWISKQSRITIKFRTDLYKLIDHFNLPRVIIECGVAEGWFTKEILKWDFDKLLLIDAWRQLNQSGDGGFPQAWHDNNYNVLTERVKPFGDKVEIRRGLSVDMANQLTDGSIGLLYLDACHEKQCVLNDLEAFLPKIVDGGIISGHDFNDLYGVEEAVTEFCKDKFDLHVIADEDYSMRGFWFQK